MFTPAGGGDGGEGSLVEPAGRVVGMGEFESNLMSLRSDATPPFAALRARVSVSCTA